MLHARIARHFVASAISGALIAGFTLAMLGSAVGAAAGVIYVLPEALPTGLSAMPTFWDLSIFSTLYGTVMGETRGGVCGLLLGAVLGLVFGAKLYKDSDVKRQLAVIAPGLARGALAGVIAGALPGALGALLLQTVMPGTLEGDHWWQIAQVGYAIGIYGGACVGALIVGWAYFTGAAPSILRACLSPTRRFAEPLAQWLAGPQLIIRDRLAAEEPVSARIGVREAIPLHWVPPLGFFRALALLMTINALSANGSPVSWDTFKTPIECVALGWLCGWIRRPQLLAEKQAASRRDRPNPLLNLICFAIPPLGLISWMALDWRWPRLARSAGHSAVRATLLWFAAYEFLLLPSLVFIAIHAIDLARLTPQNPGRTWLRIERKRVQWNSTHKDTRPLPPNHFTTDGADSLQKLLVDYWSQHNGGLPHDRHPVPHWPVYLPPFYPPGSWP